jgi:hypothetical protein
LGVLSYRPVEFNSSKETHLEMWSMKWQTMGTIRATENVGLVANFAGQLEISFSQGKYRFFRKMCSIELRFGARSAGMCSVDDVLTRRQGLDS